jgi:hypothetical protein
MRWGGGSVRSRFMFERVHKSFVHVNRSLSNREKLGMSQVFPV